jgi:3-phosphoshikimate 1-carboxyvinyltransferase
MFDDSYAMRPAAGPIRGVVQPPGSKSYTNRALVLAALADGKSTLSGALFSDDTMHMANGLRALGFGVGGDPAARRFELTGGAGRVPAEHAAVFVGPGTNLFLPPVMALGRVCTNSTDAGSLQPLLDAWRSSQGDERAGQRLPPIHISRRLSAAARMRRRSSQYFRPSDIAPARRGSRPKSTDSPCRNRTST